MSLALPTRMRGLTGFIVLAVLGACSSSRHACDLGHASAAAGPPTTVSIKPGPGHLDLVAFRDAADPTWQTATQVGPGEYEITVTGPYWLGVVCHQDDRGRTGQYSLYQLGRTLDDSHELDQTLCPADPPSSFMVTGLAGGKLSLGDGTIDLAVYTRVDAGTYSLYAVSANRLLIERNVVVDADLDLSQLDFADNGHALIPTPFTVTNTGDGVITAAAEIEIAGQDRTKAFRFSEGDPASLAVAPPDLALASNEFQTVSATETRRNDKRYDPDFGRVSTRSYRQPYQPGGPTALALPVTPKNEPDWNVESDDPSVDWSGMPDDMKLRFEMTGYRGGLDYTHHVHVLEISRAFRAATGATCVQVETDLPGYQSSWPADFIYQVNAYGDTDADPATAPIRSVSDEWVIAEE